jgi:lambda repressor-like predicted transcriptional regulator
MLSSSHAKSHLAHVLRAEISMNHLSVKNGQELNLIKVALFNAYPWYGILIANNWKFTIDVKTFDERTRICCC